VDKVEAQGEIMKPDMWQCCKAKRASRDCIPFKEQTPGIHRL